MRGSGELWGLGGGVGLGLGVAWMAGEVNRGFDAVGGLGGILGSACSGWRSWQLGAGEHSDGLNIKGMLVDTMDAWFFGCSRLLGLGHLASGSESMSG